MIRKLAAILLAALMGAAPCAALAEDVTVDESVLLDGEVKWETIAQTIRGVKSELFHGAAFVDEYRGKQVPDGKKSVTIRLAIGSKEKTLTSAEIEEVANGVIKKLVKRFGAELRSK